MASDPPEEGDISLSLEDDEQPVGASKTGHEGESLADDAFKVPTVEIDLDDDEPATGDITGDISAAEFTTADNTPVEELSQQDFTTATRHRRIDSLPPQRFEEDIAHTSRRPRADGSDSADVDGHTPRRFHTDIDEVPEDFDDSHLSEFERAGLDFVDINLGGGGGGNAGGGGGSSGLNPVYGAGGAAASKSRSSLEIRTDSISSNFKGRSSSEATPSTSAATPTSSKLMFWKRRDTPDDSTQRADGAKPGLPAAGVSMLVADEEGDVHRATSPSNDAGPDDDQPPAALPPKDNELRPPEPKATTNESQEALAVKDSERAAQEAAAHAAESRTSTSSASHPQAAGGRSAGPSGASGVEAEAAHSDVRPETAAEAEARSTATAKAGGRSAGPTAAAGSADAPPTLAISSGSVPTLAISTKSGGRSSGPITAPAPAPPAAASAGPSSPPSSQHVRKPSGGPSALERYMSRTRQATLPPKTRKEDQRHLQDFESMMRSFQALEAKRVKEDQERQRRREEELAQATKVWESEILRGDWRAARTKGSRLRLVWWKGAPPSLRGRAWQLAIGNARMLPRNLATTTRGRVKELKGKEEGKHWPPGNALNDEEPDVEAAMEEDIERTLPSLKLFQRDGGVLYEDLKETLECLVLLRAEQAAEIQREQQRRPEVQRPKPPAATAATSTSSSPHHQPRPRLYEPGLSLLTAVLLLNLSPSETLLSLLNLLASRPWLRSLYSMDPSHLSQSPAFERVLNTLLSDQLPKVYANLQHCGVDPSKYARDWVKTLFVPLLPLEVVCRLWDNIFLEEAEDEIDSMVFRTCLALVGLLSSRLHVAEPRELESILCGRNRAALSVWYRFVAQEAQLAAAGGGSGFVGAGAGTMSSSSSSQAIASLPPDSPLNSKSGEGRSRASTGAGRPSSSSSSRAKESSDSANGSAVVEEDESEAGNDTATEGEQGAASPSPSNSDSPKDEATTRPSGDTTAATTDAASSQSIEAPLSWVPRDSLFSIYAIGEANLFRALEEQTDDVSSDADGGSTATATASAGGGGGGSTTSLGSGGSTAGTSTMQWRGDGWWRDSTLKRLIERELGG